jgi:hypothetical protein
MESVIILYLPGHAGNFVARLFSLGMETIPLLPKQDLYQYVENAHIPDDYDRLENYRYSSILQNFDSWQQYHNSYADYKESSIYQLLNVFC